MASPTTSLEMQRAVIFRADALEEIASTLRGQLASTRGSLHAALALVGALPKEVKDIVSREMSSTTDPTSQIQILRPLVRHLINVLGFVETYLSHGTRRELSESLADEIRGELADLGVADHQVVLSHGEANNYATWFGDLSEALFRPLGLASPQMPPAEKFALFRVPRLEGAGVQWRPVLLGHEAAHVAVKAKDAVTTFDLRNKFDMAAAGNFPNPKAPVGTSAPFIARALYQIAESWATELICDLQALHRFGPAAVASLAEYFECIGAMGQMSVTHPPAVLRIRVLLDEVGPIADGRLNSIVMPWSDYVPAAVTLSEPWAQHLAEIFTNNRSALSNAVAVLATSPYDFDGRREWVHRAADRLAIGLPGRDSVAVGGALQIAERADTVNAAWLARVEGADTPFDSLAQKTIESTDFAHNWRDSGGTVPLELHNRSDSVDAVLSDEAGAYVLSEDALLRRMQLDHNEKGLVVARPLPCLKVRVSI